MKITRYSQLAKSCFPALVVLALLMAAPPPAPALAADTLTLQIALDKALSYSPALAQAREDRIFAQYGEKEAFTGYLPMLSTQYSYKALDSPPVASFGGMQVQTGNDRIYQWSATVTQPIFTGLRITANHRLAALGVDLAALKLRLARLDLVLGVKTAYFEYLNATKFLEVARQSVELLKAHLKTSQDFYDVGLVPVSDVLKTKVELAQAQQDLVSAQNAVQVKRAQLNTLIGAPLDRLYKVEDILAYRPLGLAYAKAALAARAERPELKAVDVQIAQAGESIRAAKSDYYPQINLSGSYISTSDRPELGDSLYYDPSGWQVATTLEWSFWEWGRTNYRVGQRRAAQRKLKAARKEAEDQVDLQVKQAYLFLRESEKNIGTAKASIAFASENYRITRESFKAQLTTNTEVLDAQTQLTRARINYYSALTVYNVAWARLERAMGRGLKRAAKPKPKKAQPAN